MSVGCGIRTPSVFSHTPKAINDIHIEITSVCAPRCQPGAYGIPTFEGWEQKYSLPWMGSQTKLLHVDGVTRTDVITLPLVSDKFALPSNGNPFQLHASVYKLWEFILISDTKRLAFTVSQKSIDTTMVNIVQRMGKITFEFFRLFLKASSCDFWIHWNENKNEETTEWLRHIVGALVAVLIRAYELISNINMNNCFYL